MKILMLNNEFPPLGGGTGTVNLELLKQFKNKPNFSIDLITASSEKRKEIVQFSERIRIIKLPLGNKNIHHASNLELITYTLKASWAAFGYHRREKYDMGFAWSTVPAGFVAFLLNLFFRLPFIVRVGGPDIPGFEERYKTIYKLISPIIRWIWKRADYLIAKCQTEADMILAINNKLNIKLIYNGIDTEKFSVKKEKQLNEPPEIICPARLIKRKGQDLVIRAIAELKKEGIIYKLNLVGDGDETENYKNLAHRLGVAEQVNFLGYVPRENMPILYQNADLFILPSYNEGMSNALLEAMACGLPVLVSDVGGTEELVDKSNGYVFQVGDSQQITLILKEISVKKEKLAAMGENSRKKAEKQSWHSIAEIYDKLLTN